MLMLNEDHAIKYGVKEAIVLHKIIFYVLLNEKDGRNEHRGKYWTFNSRAGWSDVFPCFSPMQVWRALKSLEESRAIVSDSFNRRAYDKTRWYTLSSYLLSEIRSDDYWKNALRKKVKASNKNEIAYFNSAISDNKSETPIPLHKQYK